MALYQYLVFIIQLFEIVYGLNKDISIVETNYGLIKGRVMMSAHGRLFISYSGIPYALPPVGELRFKPPQPPKPWEGILDAVKEGSVCPQLILGTNEYVGDEDCLFLNIYSHQFAANVPVLVWIHSGAFHSGDGGMKENTPENIMDQNIIFVTLNYRLGALGFLSTGNEYLPGNYGLKDQVLALKWIKENIGYFGGNSNKVTLYGAHTGGACTQLHALSPLSTGLFSRMVYQSGSALTIWMYQRNPAVVIKKVAEVVNCSVEPTKSMVDCLSKAPAESLVRTLYHFHFSYGSLPVPFMPVKEKQSTKSSDPPFLTDHPETLLKSGFLNPSPAIAGHNLQYDADFPESLMQNESWVNYVDTNLTDLVRSILHINCLPESAIMKIRQFYFGNEPIRNTSRIPLSRLFADSIWAHGTVSAARLQGIHSVQPVYYYAINYTRFERPEHRYLATETHGATLTEVAYILRRSRVPFPEHLGPMRDLIIVKRLGKILADFSDTGNPTPQKSSLIPVTWLPLRRAGLETFRFLRIEKELRMTELSQMEFSRMLFWDSIVVENHDLILNGCPE